VKKTIPTKMFYKIGEVAELTSLEPYVLRYWEGEFGLKLTKSKNHQRLYQKKDIDQIVRIKTLLYDEKFTIAGAKKKLRERRKGKEEGGEQLQLSLPHPDSAGKEARETLRKIRQELEAMMEILEAPPSGNA
jgi:DNA-binding transcriptional MerR regulator